MHKIELYRGGVCGFKNKRPNLCRHRCREMNDQKVGIYLVVSWIQEVTENAGKIQHFSLVKNF